MFNMIGTLLAIRFPQSNRKTIAHAVGRIIYIPLTILIVQHDLLGDELSKD